MTVRVKICGVTSAQDAESAIAAGADMIGLNFHPPSPRYLGLEQARVIRETIGARATVVGVFVVADRAHVEEYRRALALDILQFSGDADVSTLANWPVPVIATYRIKPGEHVMTDTRNADYILFDAFDSKLFGGTGTRLALDQLRALDLSRVIVAGGLSADNVGEVAALHPFAVDVASGVESSPGVKDHQKVRRFVANAKRAR
jgi:phosphoribosylanthranilate isomerase